MRKLWMAGIVAAAALFAQARAADDAAKERREAADATRSEVKQEAREAREEVKQEGREARTEMGETAEQARERAQAAGESAERKAGEMRADMREKKHPLFSDKENFDLEGKIQKVSKNSITVSREELPAATLNVSKDTLIELDGEQVSAAQLRAGQDVKASFNLKGDKAEAVEIKAEKRQQ